MKIELDIDLKTIEETLDTLVGRAFSLTHYFEAHPAAGSVAKQRQHANRKAKALLEFAAKLFISAGKPSFNDKDLNGVLSKELTPIIEKLKKDAEASLGALQENHVIEIDGKKYKRVSDEVFREFTGYDNFQIANPECRPRKFMWTLKSIVNSEKKFVDWRQS
jgi:hypothetical protein